jgi:hypothetical protein
MHLRLERLVDMTLAEWAVTDQQWFWEAYTALSRFQQGRQARANAEHSRHQAQC